MPSYAGRLSGFQNPGTAQHNPKERDMPKFKMAVYKTETYTTVIEVDADNEPDAALAAFNIADEMDPGNWDLEETEWEFYVDGVSHETE